MAPDAHLLYPDAVWPQWIKKKGQHILGKTLTGVPPAYYAKKNESLMAITHPKLINDCALTYRLLVLLSIYAPVNPRMTAKPSLREMKKF